MDALFTTPDVHRVFIACTQCGRTVPHYQVYGRASGVMGACKCGNVTYRPTRIPEWRAAWWVMVVGWFWRRLILRAQDWDPRMPIRQV